MDSHSSRSQVKKPGHGKLYVMVFLLAIDLSLNSSLDYDLHNIHETSFARLLLFGFQIVVQISVFLVVFLTIADTFLFRVGLLNILLRKIRAVLFIQAIYFIFTIIVGTTRLRYFYHHSRLNQNLRVQSDSISLTVGDLLGLVTNKRFVAISLVQKFCKFIHFDRNF